MITTKTVGDWLRERGLPDDCGISVDGHIPDQPDRLVVLSFTGGPGERREGLFDVRALDVLMRGAQRQPEDAEALAALVDGIFMAAGRAQIDGTYVASIARSGGPPAFLSRDSAARTAHGCIYLLECTRS